MLETNQPVYATFDQLPREVTILDAQTGRPVPAKYIKLSRLDCRDRIDKVWWSNSAITREIKRREPDSSWNWVDNFGSVRAEVQGYMQAWGLETLNDGVIQGGILYHTKSVSCFDNDAEGEPVPAVWVCYLATAPWNRVNLSSPGANSYTGVGSALLRMAVAHSYFRQGGGRVNLFSKSDLRTLAWYRNKGFVEYTSTDDGQTLLELPEGAARRLLKTWGLS